MSRPQHHKAVRLRLTSAALGLGAVVALAGCSAGQVTETDTQVAAVNGASGEVKGLAVRDAQFTFPADEPLYPAGSAAPMQLILINEGSAADRLVRVTSPYARSSEIGGFTELPSRTALFARGKSEESKPTIQSEPGAPPTSSQPPTGATEPNAAGTPSDRREVKITLKDLTQDIRPGVTIPVTFVFEKAGSLTVQVPIGADPKPRPEHGSPAGH